MLHLFRKKDRTELVERLKKIVETPTSDVSGNFLHVVDAMHKKSRAFQEIVKKHGAPCYVIDNEELLTSITNFKKEFLAHIPRAEFFYALKTNPHPYILKRVIEAGYGLDVASSRELDLGLAVQSRKFVFSGPGKTADQLRSALKTSASIAINIDSFGELERLGMLASRLKKHVYAGVRIHTSTHGDWQKFGIDLIDLKKFWNKAKQYSYITLAGIHSHTSLNEDATTYVDTIRALAKYLADNFTKKEIRDIAFVDLGGGFYPSKTDGYYPWVTPAGEIAQIAHAQTSESPPFIHPYYRIDAIPIKSYARNIGKAVKKYLAPMLDCTYYFEPGRIISSTAMHILLSVVDVKSPRCAILDGGNNMIGWERLSYDYFPVINLTHPSKKEHACELFGSLCMSGKYDTWGHYYYGSRLAEGDVLVVPYQGHLTYALAQNFIHPIPPVYIMK